MLNINSNLNLSQKLQRIVITEFTRMRFTHTLPLISRIWSPKRIPTSAAGESLFTNPMKRPYKQSEVQDRIKRNAYKTETSLARMVAYVVDGGHAKAELAVAPAAQLHLSHALLDLGTLHAREAATQRCHRRHRLKNAMRLKRC